MNLIQYNEKKLSALATELTRQHCAALAIIGQRQDGQVFLIRDKGINPNDAATILEGLARQLRQDNNIEVKHAPIVTA